MPPPNEDAPPLTSAGIARQLANLARQLDDLVSQVDDAERQAVNSREEYTRCHSRAFLSAEGAMDIRKHTALLETSDERLAAELSETHVKGLKRRVESVRLRIEIGRSLGAALRAEAGLAGSGGTP